MKSQCRPATRRRWVVAGFAVLFVLAMASAGFAATKNVLILRGGPPDLPGSLISVEQIQVTVRRQFRSPVEFFLETIDSDRFSTMDYEPRLAELYAETYGKIRLDLVVAVTAPAAEFVRDYRQKLFPHTPLLFGVIPPGFFDARPLPPTASVVYATVDAAGTLRMARSLYPAARHALVVGGTAEFDRGWQSLVRRTTRDFDPALEVTFDFDESMESLIARTNRLPADTIVLYLSMSRDGAGTPTRPRDVLQMLRAVSRVPIFGLSSTFLGYGIVGGALLDFDRHGADLGREAVRLLSGGDPRQSTTPAMYGVDWREIQRFGMNASSLPATTIVVQRVPTTWERYRWTIVTVVLVMLAQTTLILALVRAVRRRRETQARIEARLQFERSVSALSFSLSTVAPANIEEAVDDALPAIARELGIEWAWRVECGATGSAPWDSPLLRAGQAVVFSTPAELPPVIGERLAAAGCTECSSMAVPLERAGVVYGVIFWVSRLGVSTWSDRADQLQMIGATIGNILERKRAVAALEQSDRLKGAILSSLRAHVAVLDRAGTIIAVNDAWMKYGAANGVSAPAIGPGVSYLETCAAGARVGCDGAADALALIEAACRGKRGEQQVEYSCHSPERERWFLITVEPLRREEGGAVVTHLDITERKLNEIAVRESEDRFRRLADALPVGVWMSDLDAGCSYFNNQWLRMTGRTLEQQVGEGWLESVHPDDRAECKNTYLRAFQTRQRFSMDYRMRGSDGQYRWFMDVGIPRYGSDRVFHGYVGGVIDITERREAEQMLRDLNRRLLLAQDEERRRIARELHDHLSQQLALLAIDLQTLSTTPPATVEDLAAALQENWKRTAEISSEVHTISHRLHPSKLEALGLVATIRAHCRDTSRRSLPVHFSERDIPKDIPFDVSLCLFRVVEEALTNVVRHSGAQEAEVALVEASADIVLRVSDAGRGFDMTGRGASGIGLISMRERLQAVGGTLSITSAPGKGTLVEARVPRTALASLQDGQPVAAFSAAAVGVASFVSRTGQAGGH